MSVLPKEEQGALVSCNAMEGKGMHCSFSGCKQVFWDMQELMTHTGSHYIATQSLQGKLFHCSTLRCTRTFPSMQQLMDHMRQHYKPNRYFICENCKVHLRTHRALFKHLHVCAKVVKNKGAHKLEKPKPATPPATELSKPQVKRAAPELPKLQSVIRHLEKLVPSNQASAPSQPLPSQAAPSLPSSLPSVHSSLSSAPLVSPGPHPFQLLEPSQFGSSPLRFAGQSHGASMPGHFLPYVHPTSYSMPQSAVQQRLGPYVPNQAGLPASNAVWKKNQGQSFNSRIVWEHTRGRYNCLQCSHSTPSREEMTLHIEEQHKSPVSRMQGDMDFDVGLPSFHSKLTSEMESSLFSHL